MSLLDSDEMDADTVIDTYIGTDIGLSKKLATKMQNRITRS